MDLHDVIEFAKENEIENAEIVIENQSFDGLEIDRLDSFNIKDIYSTTNGVQDFIYIVI